jgi:hypothetical protein
LRQDWRIVDADGSRSPAVAKLAARIAQGPVRAPVAKRSGPVRDLVRKGILRVMRPYTSYQQRVNADLVDGLDALSRQIATVRTNADPRQPALRTDLVSRDAHEPGSDVREAAGGRDATNAEQQPTPAERRSA